MEYACASRMRIDDFRNLIVWQLADELRREILVFTDTGPASRDFKYRDQIRDAIASVCRNTAEGFDRFRPVEFARFLEFARGRWKASSLTRPSSRGNVPRFHATRLTSRHALSGDTP
jgi:hypothetical protein